MGKGNLRNKMCECGRKIKQKKCHPLGIKDLEKQNQIWIQHTFLATSFPRKYVGT